MKKSIFIWKITKIAIAFAVIALVSYLSLKNRVEEEHGLGSWEHWIRATPEVEDYVVETKDDLRPRNLKARFWTGVPRSKDSSVVRIDRNGYSLGLSRETGKTAWLSAYIPGKGAVENQNSTLRKWQQEKYANSSQLDRRSPGRGNEWIHYMPPDLMRDYYGHDADVWMGGNRFSAPTPTALKKWSRCMRMIDKYARLHGGLVVFVVPIYSTSPLDPSKIAVILIRPSEKGPSVMCSVVDVASATSLTPWELVSISEVERKTGVYFFADLPTEWRNFLLHSSQNKGWTDPE